MEAAIVEHIRYDPMRRVGSVYDIISLVTGCLPRHAKRHLDRMAATLERCGVMRGVQLHHFPGPGQRLTPVAPIHVLVTIMVLLPGGRTASRWKVNAAEVMCRAFGGDAALCREVAERSAARTNRALIPPLSTALGDMKFEVVARAPDLEGGYVYVCGSPLLRGVKVGTWRGGFEALVRRYRTYYGPHVWIATWRSARCRDSEQGLLAYLGAQCVGGELFHTDAVPRAEAWLDAAHARSRAHGLQPKCSSSSSGSSPDAPTDTVLEAAVKAHPRGHEIRMDDVRFVVGGYRRWTRGALRRALDSLVAPTRMHVRH